MRLLIVQEDPRDREALKALLAGCSLESVTAGEGEDAQRAIEKYAPAMIILDWTDRAGTGLATCQWIRQRNTRERPYLIMVTARGAAEDLVAAFSAGADDYVVRPFPPEQLRARVAAGLRLVLREYALVQEHAAVQSALARLHRMPELVPICSCCRRVKDQEESWMPVERYLTLLAGVHFTHGLCPSCAPRVMEPGPHAPEALVPVPDDQRLDPREP
jgi:CheY-like chemotaxis protein